MNVFQKFQPVVDGHEKTDFLLKKFFEKSLTEDK